MGKLSRSKGKAERTKANTPAPETPAPEGHNKPPETGKPSTHKALRGIVDQIEECEGERRALATDIKNIYAHAKDTGFSVKTLRRVVALRKRDKAVRDEERELEDQYMFALGDR